MMDSWIDREQPLAWAIVRRAFWRGTWDTSLLCSMMALQDNGYWPDPNDAPVPCWSWMADHVVESRFGSEFYYGFWNNAFEGLEEKTDPKLAHNVIVATLGGLLFDKHQRHITASFQRVLVSLIDLHRQHPMPERERAALELVKHVYRKVKPEHLTAADRLAIETAIGRLNTLVQGADAKDSLHEGSPESSVNGIEPFLVDQMEPYLNHDLGDSLWSRLSPRAKDHFKHGEFYFSLASKAVGEKGDFNSFVLAYSRGLLVEIQESVRGPLSRDPSLKREFLAQFCEKDYPEWGQLLRYIDDVHKHATTRLGKALMAQRVQLDRLETLREPFAEMKALRNDAAHSGMRIDRERAIVLHDSLINKGLIRTVVKFFPKPVRR